MWRVRIGVKLSCRGRRIFHGSEKKKTRNELVSENTEMAKIFPPCATKNVPAKTLATQRVSICTRKMTYSQRPHLHRSNGARRRLVGQKATFLCSPWANLKNRPKSWTYLQFVGGSDFFAEMDSARFELSKSVCWERKLASKVVQKVLRSGRFSPCACSLAAEPQRSFSFLLHACCHSDRAWQAILDACVRAFGPVNCFQ